jgi:eukaryotic-like serine/threonine-protein kinase
MLRRLQEHFGAAYTIENEMGGGGMSRVFLARDHALNRQVVIKVLPLSLAATVSVDRFRREIMLAAKLQHPHIVPVLTAGEFGELPYFVMPYITGESLRVRMQRGPLSVRETVAIMRDVARALAFAHRLGIVHRDIKPDNILLSAGSAVVTDFGVAKALTDARNPQHAHAGSTITSAGVSLGTPQYMSPEQAAADPKTDHRTDLYALGVVGYEMLTGVPPFHGRSQSELLRAQMTEAPQPLASRRYDVPIVLSRLVMQSLEKNPDHRPRTADAVARTLESPEAASGEFDSPASARLRRAWQRPILLAGAALVIAAASIAYASLRGGDDARPGSSTVELYALESLGPETDTTVTRTLTTDLANALRSVPGLQVVAAADFFGVVSPDSTRGAYTMRMAGTVQREGQRLRVNLRLSRLMNDSTLWSGRFDGRVGDLLTLEDEIAAGVTEGIRAQLVGK